MLALVHTFASPRSEIANLLARCCMGSDQTRSCSAWRVKTCAICVLWRAVAALRSSNALNPARGWKGVARFCDYKVLAGHDLDPQRQHHAPLVYEVRDRGAAAVRGEADAQALPVQEVIDRAGAE